MPIHAKSLPILLAGCLLAVTGCNGPRVSDAHVRVIGESAVAREMRDAGTVLLDVRRPERYAQGHIPGAINIHMPQLGDPRVRADRRGGGLLGTRQPRGGDPRLLDADLIVVYAQGWDDPLSTASAKRLMALRYRNVRDFKGGVEAWAEAGHELVTPEPAEPEPAEE